MPEQARFTPLRPSAPVHEVKRTRDGYTAVSAEATPDQWENPILFESISLPPFPLGVHPPAIREFVYAVSETVQAPVEMVGSCVLGALEIACKGRYPVKLPNGHIERACLYIAPIAPPSERKSGVTDVITKPHIEYEIGYNQDHGG